MGALVGQGGASDNESGAVMTSALLPNRWSRSISLGSNRALAAIILASALVVPLLFTIAVRDTFGLPKIRALQVIAVVGLILFTVRLAVGGITWRSLLGPVNVVVLAFVLLNIAAFV